MEVFEMFGADHIHIAQSIMSDEKPSLYAIDNQAMHRVCDLTPEELETHSQVFIKENGIMRSCSVCNSAHLHLHNPEEDGSYFSLQCFGCYRAWHGPFQLVNFKTPTS